MRARAASAVAFAFSAAFSASSLALARVSRAVSLRGFIVVFLHVGLGLVGHHIVAGAQPGHRAIGNLTRSEEHTSELQSLMRISYAVFCLKKKNNKYTSSYN